MTTPKPSLEEFIEQLRKAVAGQTGQSRDDLVQQRDALQQQLDNYEAGREEFLKLFDQVTDQVRDQLNELNAQIKSHDKKSKKTKKRKGVSLSLLTSGLHQ